MDLSSFFAFVLFRMFICSEKAELFEKLHNYEVKLDIEQSKKWVADEDVDNCTKCNAVFGWTVRKVS